MVKRLLISIVITVLVLGGITLGIYKVLHNRVLRDEAAQELRRQDISITIIEGKRWEEIAAELDKAGVTPYNDFVAVMLAHPDYEGTLFPDTYRFFPNTPATDVIAELRKNYQLQVSSNPPSLSDLVLASIVEREASNDADRPVIAGVYANRLRVGMTMGADPTVQYAKDTLGYTAAGHPESYVFWTAITQADYHNVQSLFNTYQQTGLPPYPISNPGLKSIAAAENPTPTDYLFFGYKNGKLLLSKTLAEHEAQLSD